MRAWAVCPSLVFCCALPSRARRSRRAGGRDPDGRHARRLRDIRRGRALGGQHEHGRLAGRRTRLERLLGHAHGEAIPGCHRSKAAQAHIGGGVASLNLACSGAKTSTGGTGSGENFKPGIDFYTGPKGVGQALALQEYAKTHNVKAVVVMIGANNYGFAAIVERCVTNWVTSPSLVEELLLGRLRHDVALHRDAAGGGDGERARRAGARRAGDDERGLRRRASTRSSRRPTGRRSRAARRSATPRAAGRASPSAAAAHGTATSTGPTTPSWRR